MNDVDSIFVPGPCEMGEQLHLKDAMDLLAIQQSLGIIDNGFDDRNDQEERIILTYRKLQKNSHNPFEKFAEVKLDTKDKCDTLQNIFMRPLVSAFRGITTGPLSQVLLEENLLTHDDLLEELESRGASLCDLEILIIIAGETNGGKSTFLNIILGEPVLPTDVIHCTSAICKIKYSKTYSIETLDHHGKKELLHYDNHQEVCQKLKILGADENMINRLKGPKYKEITLRMPSPILESGVTLVDTPGIGEDEAMDDVTMNYIRSTKASGFIYIIKSDASGGIQEDTLVSCLKAVQEDYKQKNVEGPIDPKAALFVCNRWDQIEKTGGVEKVKKNALTQLENVWPGFQTDQVHFISSKKAQLHLDADPEFVTDKMNELLLDMKKLFNRAVHNHIRHQYIWAKHFLYLSSQHLSSMINHCISNNEDLEELFRTVATKQEILIKRSNEINPQLKQALFFYKMRLKSEVCQTLSKVKAVDLEDHDMILNIIGSERNFLHDSKNRKQVDQWLVTSLIRHCDNAMQERGILDELETTAKSMIEEHIGLFQEQLEEITELVKGRVEVDTEIRRLSGQSNQSQQQTPLDSPGSSEVGSSAASSTVPAIFADTYHPQLNDAVRNFMGRKKRRAPRILNSLAHISTLVQRGGLKKYGWKDYNKIPGYVEYRVEKNARLMCDNEAIIEGFALGYLHIIEMYINSALEHIPHFIGVNNTLMENIRIHRKALQDNKGEMKTVMDKLEPCREHIRGYGLLYMEDVNADSVKFNTSRRNSSIDINEKNLGSSSRLQDSGNFSDCGSSRNRSRGFWTDTVNAGIKVDGEPSDMTIKMYTCTMDKNHQLSEMASLRCLKHKNLAPFFGMTRISNCNDSDETQSHEKMSAFIFEGSLISARVYKSNKLIVLKDFIKSFIHGLISGLEYIHRENMVHLELNLDTVMVNFETGVVQLCQQCHPRVAQIPDNCTMATNTSVCLSPMVLLGHEYSICDDIYAFSLLLWELLFPENPPYAQQRQWRLETFIEKVRPSEMLGPEIDQLPASDALINVLKGTLTPGKGVLCMSMRDIKSNLMDMGDDPTVKTMRRERRPPIKTRCKDKLYNEDPANIPHNSGRRHTSAIVPSLQDLETQRHAIGTSHPERPPRPKKEAAAANGKRRSSVPSLGYSFGLPDRDSAQSRSVSDLVKQLLENPVPPFLELSSKNSFGINTSCAGASVNPNTIQTSGTKRREKKMSLPDIRIGNLSKLREMHECHIDENGIVGPNNIPTDATVFPHNPTVPVQNGQRRRRSVTEISLDDRSKLQNTAQQFEENKAVEKSKKFKKHQLQRQMNFGEYNDRLLTAKKNTMYLSMPANLNNLSSENKKVGVFSRIRQNFRKLRSKSPRIMVSNIRREQADQSTGRFSSLVIDAPDQGQEMDNIRSSNFRDDIKLMDSNPTPDSVTKSSGSPRLRDRSPRHSLFNHSDRGSLVLTEDSCCAKVPCSSNNSLTEPPPLRDRSTSPRFTLFCSSSKSSSGLSSEHSCNSKRPVGSCHSLGEPPQFRNRSRSPRYSLFNNSTSTSGGSSDGSSRKTRSESSNSLYSIYASSMLPNRDLSSSTQSIGSVSSSRNASSNSLYSLYISSILSDKQRSSCRSSTRSGGSNVSSDSAEEPFSSQINSNSNSALVPDQDTVDFSHTLDSSSSSYLNRSSTSTALPSVDDKNSFGGLDTFPTSSDLFGNQVEIPVSDALPPIDETADFSFNVADAFPSMDSHRKSSSDDDDFLSFEVKSSQRDSSGDSDNENSQTGSSPILSDTLPTLCFNDLSFNDESRRGDTFD